jgi:hypothetical protein
MNENEKRAQIKTLIEELMNIRKKLREEGYLDEERECEIYIELDKLSPDPSWSNYLGAGSIKDENENFLSDEYFDSERNLLMQKFLDKIFSYQPIIL